VGPGKPGGYPGSNRNGPDFSGPFLFDRFLYYLARSTAAVIARSAITVAR